jgi:hypothetical protein
MPFWATHWKAWSICPPAQPAFPSWAQSTSAWADSEIDWLCNVEYRPSKAPAAENAQQEPQAPWFFTEETAFFYLQSID